MKIVDYEAFVRMPAGTIFTPWEPCVMKAEPEIKVDHGREILIESGGKLKKIWYFNGTCHIIPQPVGDTGVGFDFGEVESEFWYYDGDSNDASDYKMFLIFEEEDIDNMIKLLQWAKDGCPGEDPNEMLKGESDAGI